MMLTQPCNTLSHIGPVLAQKLLRCGINTVQDLLLHLPFRYQDRTRITPIQDIQENEWCVISGKIIKVDVTLGKRRTLHCEVSDQTGIIKLRFFYFHNNQVQQLRQKPIIRAFGEVKQYAQRLEMIHPEYQLINTAQPCQVEEHFTPIYHTTQGLSQTRLRSLIQTALSEAQSSLASLEWLSPQQLVQHQLLEFKQAIEILHAPSPDIALEQLETGQHPALKRLIFDELIARQLSMQIIRNKRTHFTAPIFSAEKTQAFIEQLPFRLTTAQTRVVHEVQADLHQPTPMLRLVQGDVGSGKTVIAAIAAFQAIQAGYQVALMAPTDLLSEQHFLTLNRWFQNSAIRIFRLTGQMKSSERKKALLALQNHQCDFIIGTHALFQKNVQFAKPGLMIIDEQHRFGVLQRLQLHQKGYPDQGLHQLLMTATPIPRTLAMSHYAHLDVSIIDELPPGRTPIITAILHQEKRNILIERLTHALKEGRQVYWVCPLIDESEKLQCMAAVSTQQMLQDLLPRAKIGLIHGKLSSKEKEAVMQAFKQQNLNILVATTVIEVGIDVPNASLMIIENAERLGLSQLHQLRGRVGRGSQASHCLLLYQTPLSAHSRARLNIMRETNDGFVIAEQDLKLRGAGDLLGTQQTGFALMKIAQLYRDQALLPMAKEIARNLLKTQPTLAYEIAKRWLGEFEQYIHG